MEKIKQLVIIVFITVIGLIIAGCSNGNEPEKNEPEQHSMYVLRYETVPFIGNNTDRSAGNNALDKLIYYGYDDEKYFYVFLLGHINYVPITFRNSVIYNGVRPVTIEFSLSDATEQSVARSAEYAIEHSTNSTIGVETGIKANIGFKAGIAEGSLESNVSVSASEGYGTARSTRNTYETMISYVNENSDTFSEIIGNYNEPQGKYRYALFGTTDVYYVIVTDKSKLNKLDEYFSVCGRDSSYTWGIDYDPDIGGNFGKTGEGELLTVPALVLSALPVPTNRIVPGNVPSQTPAAKPSANPKGGTLNNQTTISLTTTTPGAAIYYTISDNGSAPPDPTNYSTRYTDLGISLNQKSTNTTYIIKARAYHDYMLESPIMTEVYIINADVLVPKFQAIEEDPYYEVRLERGGNSHNWYVSTHFNYEYRQKLRSQGYTRFFITLEYNARQANQFPRYGYLWASLWKGHTRDTNGIEYNSHRTDGTWGSWYSRSLTTELTLDEFDDNGRLTVRWSATPEGLYNIKDKKITIEARK